MILLFEGARVGSTDPFFTFVILSRVKKGSRRPAGFEASVRSNRRGSYGADFFFGFALEKDTIVRPDLSTESCSSCFAFFFAGSAAALFRANADRETSNWDRLSGWSWPATAGSVYPPFRFDDGVFASFEATEDTIADEDAGGARPCMGAWVNGVA